MTDNETCLKINQALTIIETICKNTQDKQLEEALKKTFNLLNNVMFGKFNKFRIINA